MTLTPVEIRHLKPSKTLIGGYNRDAVGRLLDEIVASFEDVWRERADMSDKVDQLESDLVRYRELEGLLRTMYDPRNTLALNVSADLQKHFGEKLYRTVIPRNVRLAEAPSHGIPVLYLDKSSKGAQAYLALAGEMLRRLEAEPGAVPA